MQTKIFIATSNEGKGERYKELIASAGEEEFLELKPITNALFKILTGNQL